MRTTRNSVVMYGVPTETYKVLKRLNIQFCQVPYLARFNI